MKIRTLALALAFSLLLPNAARADEGMWLLSLIGKNYTDMQRAGFKLTPEDIYSINRSCLKDAIVGLGNAGTPFWHFCTGEIISKQGLMSTNHHCGYGKIQEHSTVEHDYLRDGFWAYTKDQELPNPGLTASILVRMEDVTDKVKEVITDEMSEDDRQAAIEKISEALAAKATEGTLYNATVKPMFNGNQFFLFVHIIYRDVRLVGAPPRRWASSAATPTTGPGRATPATSRSSASTPPPTAPPPTTPRTTSPCSPSTRSPSAPAKSTTATSPW